MQPRACVVTIAVYNFAEPKYRALWGMWLALVRHALPDARIIAITDRHTGACLDSVEKIIGERDCEGPVLWNVGFKLYNLCRLSFPHIYLDLDTAVLGDLSSLVELSVNDASLYTAAIQGKGPGFNSGVYVAPRGMAWIDYATIRRRAINRKFAVPGYDQAALWHWFQNEHIEWTSLPPSYNMEASRVKVNFNGKWSGIDEEGNTVHISHYWRRKPWDSGCPMYQSFLNDEINQRASPQGDRRHLRH